MILPDRTIKTLSVDEGLITPFVPDQLQPASYDVRLGSHFKRINGYVNGWRAIEPGLLPDGLYEDYDHEGHVDIPPQGFLLGSTVERVDIPATLVCRVEGKSSLARLGLLVHVTAGFVDPGFKGRLTLELYNLAPLPIRLRPGMLIAQLSFSSLEGKPDRCYGDPALNSKYQGDDSTVGSRYG